MADIGGVVLLVKQKRRKKTRSDPVTTLFYQGVGRIFYWQKNLADVGFEISQNKSKAVAVQSRYH